MKTKTQNTESETATQIQTVVDALVNNPGYSSQQISKLTGESDELVVWIRYALWQHEKETVQDLIKNQAALFAQVANLQETKRRYMETLPIQQQLEAKAMQARFMADLVLD